MTQWLRVKGLKQIEPVKPQGGIKPTGTVQQQQKEKNIINTIIKKLGFQSCCDNETIMSKTAYLKKVKDLLNSDFWMRLHKLDINFLFGFNKQKIKFNIGLILSSPTTLLFFYNK
jgi:hypothetical protein